MSIERKETYEVTFVEAGETKTVTLNHFDVMTQEIGGKEVEFIDTDVTAEGYGALLFEGGRAEVFKTDLQDTGVSLMVDDQGSWQ